MIARAEAKYSRISPTKVRPVMDLIKTEKTAKTALTVLEHTNKKGALFLAKVLKSAISNAKNKGYSETDLTIGRMVANSGPVLKRHRAATFGRATQIRKRTSHIVIELNSKEELVKTTKTKVKVKKA